MANRFLQKVSQLELEEKILNGAALVGIAGVFFPWFSGLMGTEEQAYSGFEYFTGFIGIAVFLLLLFLLLITLVPIFTGKPLIKRAHKQQIRLLCTVLSTVLTLAALSVLTKVSVIGFRGEIRFGIYITLIGSLVASLYCYLRYQEEHRSNVHEFFHHPEDSTPASPSEENAAPPPPPPPPPDLGDAEEHRLLP